MVLNYNGVLYSYYVGGELKRPGRTYMYASCISIAVLVVVWVGIWMLLRWRIGLDFMQAQANLNAVNGDAYSNITSLSAQAGGLGYGLVLSGDPITKILFSIAVPSPSSRSTWRSLRSSPACCLHWRLTGCFR